MITIIYILCIFNIVMEIYKDKWKINNRVILWTILMGIMHITEKIK